MKRDTKSALDAFVKELEAARTGDGMTSQEMSDALDIPVRSVRKDVLTPAKRAGRLVNTFKVIESLSGVRMRVAAYKIVKAK